MLPPSPCIGICRIDDATGLCAGCARTGEEIAIWRQAPPPIVDAIWAALPARRARLGIGLYRLRWTAERIVPFVANGLRHGRWTVEADGAVRRWHPDGPVEVTTEGGRVTARTARGGLTVEVTDRTRVLALGDDDPSFYALALPQPAQAAPTNGPLRGASPVPLPDTYVPVALFEPG